MCGFCGVIDRNIRDIEMGMAMVKTMLHRGPDHQNVQAFPENDCLLGHARLSIIDLSEAANQPMEYGDYVIVYNGEVYNFREIRKELEELGHQFVMDSDTEVILHAFAEWGRESVKRFIGMFAFAVLDRKKNVLTLVRDRAGVKPLYFYERDGVFMFASELKAFYPHPLFQKKINKKAVAQYFKYGYVPAPNAIFENTSKLRPGHILEYHISTRQKTLMSYWDVMSFYKRPRLTISYQEAEEEMEKILKSAFEYRMVADVPVGLFLSGGYDSTLLATLLQSNRTKKLKTYTIGFEDEKWNEATAAKNMACRLGTEHTEYICTQDDCKKILSEFALYFDEPFSDNSAVPTILVSQLARQNVTVALSADGGDETFAGYNRYDGIDSIRNVLQSVKWIQSNTLTNVSRRLTNLLTAPYSFLREKGETFSRLLSLDPSTRVSMATEHGSYSTLTEGVYGELSLLSYPESQLLLDEREFDHPVSVATALDYVTYMPDDILVKVDRATMSVSLEGREPLLDHRIVEFAAQLPIAYKFQKGNKKRIYKDILYKYVPREMMERPKTGFMMPVDPWLRGDLRYLLEEHLNDSLSPEFFRVENVKRMKELFLQEKLGNENKVIWRILAFQLWYYKHVKLSS